MYNMDILNSDKQFEIKFGSRHYGQKYYLFNKLLIKLKFNVSSIGFGYWITALIIATNENKHQLSNIESIYNAVAKFHNSTRTRVERAMRTARSNADEEIRKVFNYELKLTNKTILNLILTHILYQNNYKHIPHLD